MVQSTQHLRAAVHAKCVLEEQILLELLKDAAPGTDASMSDSGWSNTDIFRRFLMEHFIKYIPHREPGQLLLILDGHKSHIAIDIIEWAKQNNIVIFVLPAHLKQNLYKLQKVEHILQK
jgi:L-ascorbate metabolism protein UlaG (beta-lactamase superfamily)